MNTIQTEKVIESIATIANLIANLAIWGYIVTIVFCLILFITTNKTPRKLREQKSIEGTKNRQLAISKSPTTIIQGEEIAKEYPTIIQGEEIAKEYPTIIQGEEIAKEYPTIIQGEEIAKEKEMTVKELKEIAKENKIPGWSRMKKAELIKALRSEKE